jgi:hypothetical protein
MFTFQERKEGRRREAGGEELDVLKKCRRHRLRRRRRQHYRRPRYIVLEMEAEGEAVVVVVASKIVLQA